MFDPIAAAKRLDQLTLDYWRCDEKAKFAWQDLVSEALTNGYKLSKKRVNGNVIHTLKAAAWINQIDINGVPFKARSKTKLAKLLIYDGRPKGMKVVNGCCTTRAMSYVLKDMTFEEIYKKQRTLGGSRWNCVSFYFSKILAPHGYKKIYVTDYPSVRHNRSEAALAAKLFSIKNPILFDTCDHMAVIDNSHGVPCIVDYWDSRNNRIEILFAKAEDEDRVRRILSNSRL